MRSTGPRTEPGFGFLWTDLVCYSVRIAIGALAELGIGRLGGSKLEKVSRRKEKRRASISRRSALTFQCFFR